ncbi:MAG: RNA polymerase sigma factor [Myxococcales bacterium]|nr:RNA polymerase sigma factor [Myxococcales bacterium]
MLERIGQLITKKEKPTPVTRLVERCREGDAAAFRELFERHVHGVHRHLSLLMGPGEDVDDLVQLVFLNVFQSICRFQGKSAFSTWLFRITLNVARQEIRSRGRQRRLNAAVAEVQQAAPKTLHLNPEVALSTEEEIYRTLDVVSLKKRETLILYLYEGYSLEEIANLLNSSVSTIGSRLQSGRKEILEHLAAQSEKKEGTS